MHQPAQRDLRSRRLAIVVRGVVQGVGFRPFVYNAARRHGLAGWVLNESDQVRIEVQGDDAALSAFLDQLRHRVPPQARVDGLEVTEIDAEQATAGSFEIRRSTAGAAPRPTIPADLATCAACAEEIRTPGERRYRYPFTNCTNCGPRWSIIGGLPYDRPRTSMAGFAMCDACRAEYEDPADRRFHAQPIACPRCGPALSLLDPAGAKLAVGDEALRRAAESLGRGEIVALKGLGGFQLLVDATDRAAVARLRERKRRPDRPFAVLLGTLDEVRRHCELSADESAVLASPQAPILLLARRSGPVPRPIADAVAPGNPLLGVMLPYTPLHHLLCDALARPLVCTSGNFSEEPMVTETDDAVRRLGPIADLILTHNRPIVRPVDDSVARLGPDGLQVLRRARGYSPLPIELRDQEREPKRAAAIVAPRGGGDGSPADGLPVILAVGGHLKNTVALALPRRAGTGGVAAAPAAQVILSPHVGDLESVLAVDVFRRAVDDLVRFFEVAPQLVACDLHPDYASTRHAERLAAAWNVPLVRVQHHQAHVAACMAEHGLDGPVLGLSWDGTGYGADGTVWGGEVLLCDGARFERAAHLRTFPLPGSEVAVRQPRRSAFGLLYEALGSEAVRCAGEWFSAEESRTVLAALDRRLNCPRTSSMGRLFDAVAALCGLPPVISFEGQAAMALEFAADPHETASYPLPVVAGRKPAAGQTASPSAPLIVDWEPLLHAVLSDRAAGVPAGQISARFHNALAEAAVAVARAVGAKRVVLTGGCFQNALLTGRVRQRLSEAGFTVYAHQKVPPGDGGIALGQVYVAARQWSAGHAKPRTLTGS